ncbi:thiol peroxidase [Arenibacter sp. GZD96]|uniref:thiol peroxidase n=1 Tax=Aurantibrevibacter litoralis TaxID=3106030 RepID=UPI002AFE8E14|nr:thiol peroxidase [Arenibacter sp. GZD-96]MEA1786309.1 thiol peroxidase [Arenibacter sp. GZD-96]
MATVTLKGNTIHTVGDLPKTGSKAPDFNLVKGDLSLATLADYRGHKVVLNIFPSIDTGTCAQSVRQFNEEAAELENTKVLCISKDLPFAQGRFCGAEGIDQVELLSDFRDGNFGTAYQVAFTDGPLEGLHSRAVVVLDANGTVVYSEQVPEIVDEPNYKAALEALMNA